MIINTALILIRVQRKNEDEDFTKELERHVDRHLARRKKDDRDAAEADEEGNHHSTSALDFLEIAGRGRRLDIEIRALLLDLAKPETGKDDRTEETDASAADIDDKPLVATIIRTHHSISVSEVANNEDGEVDWEEKCREDDHAHAESANVAAMLGHETLGSE